MKKILISMLALSLLQLSACGASAPAHSGIVIASPFAHAAGAGETSAVYMSITNTGAEADRLVSVSCDAAGMTQAMESRMNGDVMSMSDVPAIDLPAGATLELKPGGYHIMLMGLVRELKAGNTISLTLKFEKAGTITLDVPVLAAGETP